MAEYAKKTVAELTEILKSRGLPSSGKKAELVARLNEDDKNAPIQAAEGTAPETTAAAEEEVSETAPAAEDGAAEEVDDPATATATEPTADIQPTSTDAADSAAANTTTEETQVETAIYTLNLKASDVDSELAKRKARAERFGTGSNAATGAGGGGGGVAATSTDDTTITTTTTGSEQQATTQSDADAQALKNLERAKRFGTEIKAISKLDEALPSERERRGGGGGGGGGRANHKRKAEDSLDKSDTLLSNALNDPGLKKGFANRIGGGGGGGGRFRNRGGRHGGRAAAAGAGGGNNPRGPQGVTKPPPAYTSEKDKLAAEARKKKFATA